MGGPTMDPACKNLSRDILLLSLQLFCDYYYPLLLIKTFSWRQIRRKHICERMNRFSSYDT